MACGNLFILSSHMMIEFFFPLLLHLMGKTQWRNKKKKKNNHKMNKKRTTTTVNGLPHLPMPCIGRHQRLPKWIMGLGQVTISIEWSLRAISDPIHKWIYAFCAMQQKNILFAKNAIDRAAKVALAALAAIQQHISSQSVHHSTMPGRSCASKIYIYIERTVIIANTNIP